MEENIKQIAPLILALLALAAPARAQDPKPGETRDGAAVGRPARLQALTPSSPSRSSPHPTPTPADTLFVVDEEPGQLDTECQFRSSGSLKFGLQVKRYLGPLNAATSAYSR